MKRNVEGAPLQKKKKKEIKRKIPFLRKKFTCKHASHLFYSNCKVIRKSVNILHRCFEMKIHGANMFNGLSLKSALLVLGPPF